MLLLLIAVLFIGAAVSLGLRAVTFSRVANSERLSDINAYGFVGRPAPGVEKSDLRDRVDRFATLVGELVDRRLDRKHSAELRRQLSAAGFYRLTPRKFLGYRVLVTLVLPMCWLWLTTFSGGSFLSILFGTVILGAIGWIAPSFWLKRRSTARLQEIDHEMPELVDLLVTAVEGGLGFGGSLQVAARSIEGPLGEELRLTLQEQSMGLSTTESLKNMLARVDSLSVRAFVQAIVQGESLGVSVGKIMRDLAKEMRSRRRQAAEERAHKAGTKIIMPVALCIFPAIFVVALGPMVIYLLHTIGGQ
jgi:tight adherence protein C